MLDPDSLLKVTIVVNLGATQLAVMVIDNFLRNLLENLTLHSPHHEWHHFEVQFFKGSPLLVGEEKLILSKSCEIHLEQFLIVFFKLFLGVEIPRHEKIEETPELYKSVLNGGSSQDKTVQSIQPLDCLELQSFYIFYQVPLIQNYKLQVDL